MQRRAGPRAEAASAGPFALEYKREAPRALVGPRRGRQESMITDEFSIPTSTSQGEPSAPQAHVGFFGANYRPPTNLSWQR